MKVIIIGGGIAGLTCARACLDAGMEVEVYEKRDLESMIFGPGGIFIQQNAMRVYDLLWQGKIRESLYREGAKILKGGFFSKKAELLYLNSPNFANLEDLGICLLRPKLQRILYDSLPEGIVRTNAAFTKFTETPEGVHVSFADGKEAWGNVLIGGDGLYSKVRAFLAGEEQPKPAIYSGMTCWRGWFDKNNLPLDQRYSWAELWGCGDRFGYFDVGDGKFSFYAFKNSPSGGDDQATGGAKKTLQAMFADYPQPIPAIIDSLNEETIYRDDICDREPLGTQWGRG
jgi:2-polyprenyl-6-methoxyphenol hydroxylase-like FAD-dependent oxidoreductase